MIIQSKKNLSATDLNLNLFLDVGENIEEVGMASDRALVGEAGAVQLGERLEGGAQIVLSALLYLQVAGHARDITYDIRIDYAFF